MKWIIFLCATAILLTGLDCIVHLAETTTTADVLSQLAPEYAGTQKMRRAFAGQLVWTLASIWVVLSQIAIIVLVVRSVPKKDRPIPSTR